MSEPGDSLGLDKPIRLGRVQRIPKITDELLFENNRGLPQIRQNYRKLSKALKQSDKQYAEKSKSLPKNAAHQLKIATESENLTKVLSFYQLWCHGLFPRANFQDCLRILRNHKSPALRVYRRDLIDNEIKSLKIEKGIIVEDEDLDGGSSNEDHQADSNNNVDVNGADENVVSSDEDNWGFLSVNSRSTNGLFIGEEEEEREGSGTPVQATSAPAPEEVDFDDLDENDFFVPTTNSVLEDEHQAELDIMNQMGM